MPAGSKSQQHFIYYLAFFLYGACANADAAVVFAALVAVVLFSCLDATLATRTAAKETQAVAELGLISDGSGDVTYC